MRRLPVLLIFVVLVFSGCGKDNVKPSEDYITSTKALESIAAVQEAYEGRKKGTLKKWMGPELYDSTLRETDFKKAELKLTTRLVTIKENSVVVNMNWQGTWQFRDKKDLNSRGAANLFVDRETMRLLKIEGDNPFSVPKIVSY